MSTHRLELDEELVSLLGELRTQVEEAARELIVVELYRRGRIPADRGARLLGVSEEIFIEQTHLSSGRGPSTGNGSDQPPPEGRSHALLERMKRRRFTPEGKAERVERSLAALHQPESLQLTPEDWQWVAEDPDIEDQF